MFQRYFLYIHSDAHCLLAYSACSCHTWVVLLVVLESFPIAHFLVATFKTENILTSVLLSQCSHQGSAPVLLHKHYCWGCQNSAYYAYLEVVFLVLPIQLLKSMWVQPLLHFVFWYLRPYCVLCSFLESLSAVLMGRHGMFSDFLKMKEPLLFYHGIPRTGCLKAIICLPVLLHLSLFTQKSFLMSGTKTG